MRRTIVCLCGSTRFSQAFQEANFRETLNGNIVLSIGCDTKSDEGLKLTDADKAKLDELHLDKIKLADEVLFLNVDGYIGSSTQRELAFAILHDKSIRWLDRRAGEQYIETHTHELGKHVEAFATRRYIAQQEELFRENYGGEAGVKLLHRILGIDVQEARFADDTSKLLIKPHAPAEYVAAKFDPNDERGKKMTQLQELRSHGILDHGYLKVIESWGSDERIIEAARMSTNKGFEGWGPFDVGPCEKCLGTGLSTGISELGAANGCDACVKGRLVKSGDEKLLAYLYSHKHMTPFEMAGMVVEVQAPIMVFREWQRHRTQSYNEMSARYSPLPDLNYIPTVERLMINAGGSNRQAGTVKGSKALTADEANRFRQRLQVIYEGQQSLYEDALEAGVPKELARVHLPVGRYSRMRACANLRNWLAFLTLRAAPDAQWEIRQYAFVVAEQVRALFPRTYALFVGEA